MSNRQFICIECNRSDGVPAVVINGEEAKYLMAWWKESAHFNTDLINVEFENDVEVADTKATMTTVAISGEDIMSVVPFDFLINGRPVIVINQRGRSKVYVGGSCVKVCEDEPDAHRYAEALSVLA